MNNTHLVGFELSGQNSPNGTRPSYARLGELDSFWHYLRSQRNFTDGSTSLVLSWAINASRDYIPADQYRLVARLDNVTGANIPGGGDVASFAIARSNQTVFLDCSEMWLRANRSQSEDGKSKGLSQGAIAGIVIAAIVALIVGRIISVYAWRRRWRIAALVVRPFSKIARRALPSSKTKNRHPSRPVLEQHRVDPESQTPLSPSPYAGDSGKEGLPTYAEGAATNEVALLPEEPSAPPSYESLYDRFILRDEETQRRDSKWEGKRRWRKVFGV